MGKETTETVKEQTKEKAPKNIYAKMATVKSKLLGIKKGGKNDFSHYNYFELGDILPVLTPALEEERLYMKTQFSATEQIAKLIVIDIDAPENQIDFEIKFAECALKGAHEIQNLGAAQTYTRRYLIMTAFDVAEVDIVDGGAEKDEKKEAQKKAEQEKAKQQPAPKPLQPPPNSNNPPPTLTETEKLRRETWELIKKFPKDKQSGWINECKGANAAKLKELIDEMNEELKLEQREAEAEMEREQMQQQEAAPAEQQDVIPENELPIY